MFQLKHRTEIKQKNKIEIEIKIKTWIQIKNNGNMTRALPIL